MVKMHRFNRGRVNRYAAESNNNNESRQVPIRSLYVGDIKPLNAKLVKRYFECFGEVENIRFHSKDEFQYGFVQFKSADSAQAVLGQGYWHRIGKGSVKVKAADLHHQPDFKQKEVNPLLVAPPLNSDLHILIALNDDCLREVFAYFDLFDLSNAAKVCTRFNQHATAMFENKYKDLDLVDAEGEYKPITKDQIYNILQNFGSMIRTLKIDQFELPDKIPFLSTASRYCTTLKQLQMRSFPINGKLMKKRQLFEKLEKFHLIFCEFGKKVNDLHSVCTELKSLKLDGCDMNMGKIIKQNFQKLNEFHLIDCYNIDENTIDSFIKMNKSLTRLWICGNDDWATSEPIRSIGQNLNQLIELEIDQDICDMAMADVVCLGQLRALKVLKLNFNSISVTPLLKALAENKIAIEDLQLNGGDLDDKAIEYIVRMKQIKKLEFNGNTGVLSEEHLIQIGKELSNLEVLHLKESPNDVTTTALKRMLTHAHKLSLLHLESVYTVSINADDYKAMLKTVKSRPEKIKLVIKIESDGDKVEVDDCVLAENRDIFYIDEEVEDDDNPWNRYDDYDDTFDFDDDDYNFFSDDEFYQYHDSDADSENGFGFGYMLELPPFYFD